MNKNILFITWDSNLTSYVENLFIPIFQKIQERSEYSFVIIQYTWALQEQINKRKQIAEHHQIVYHPIKIKNNFFSKIVNIIRAYIKLPKFCRIHNIDYIMPRSIWPSLITLLCPIRLPTIYDADGLAYLEKKEYGSSFIQLMVIKLIEKYIVKKSKLIFTRSKYGINWIKDKYNPRKTTIFKIVGNGVSENTFYPDYELRLNTREVLKLSPKQTLFIYVGSIGEKYGLQEAITIFEKYSTQYPNSKFLILTAQTDEIKEKLPSGSTSSILLRHIPHQHINAYLNAADIGFCLIAPSNAIKAVNPVKLNEYLMTGLPVVLNHDIGDTEEWFQNNKFCVFIDYHKPQTTDLHEIDNLKKVNRKQIRNSTFAFCSLSITANNYISGINSIDPN